MPDTLTVCVPGRYPSINQWMRMPWYVRMKKAAKWKADTTLLTRMAVHTHPTVWTPATWATLEVRHHVRALRRRDNDNYSSVKHALDGLVAGGALADDNSEVLRKSSVEFVRDGKEELELIVTRLDRST